MKTRPKILVMDDDPVLLETASELLRTGFDVITYRAAFNRLNVVREHQPDLILMDVNMPLVPGDEVTKLLKDSAELSGIPVVLFSSNDEQSLRQMARNCGAVGYISKSEMGWNFAAKVERHLRALGRGQ
jgi:CheY-like chemotaxis protein